MRESCFSKGEECEQWGNYHRAGTIMGSLLQVIMTRSLTTVSLQICFLFSPPRKRYRKVLYYVVVIQKNYRAFSGRKKFLCLKKAATVLQKQWRGQLARRLYRERLEEKRRQEEERRKEEEERCSLQLTSLSCLCHFRCWSESLLFRLFLNKWFWKPLLLLLKEAYSSHVGFIFTNIIVVILFLAVFSRWQMISVSWAIATAKECDELMLSLIDWLFFFTHF